MATYKGIRGLTIRTIDGDASPVIAGDIWYNSSSKKIRGAKKPAGSWASSPAVNTGRHGSGTAGQTTEACLIAGGIGGQQLNEVWDGSSWSEAGDLVTKKHYAAAFGTSTAAIIAAGTQAGLPDPNHVATAQEWDNSSWTEIADLNTQRSHLSGTGATSTSGMMFGGGGWASSPLDTIFAIAETWNGSSWTEGPDMNTAKHGSGGTGPATAALCISGGPSSSTTATVELYNGSAWSEQADLNEGRYQGGCGGTSTSAIHFGGTSPSTSANTEQYDGTSWTEGANLPAAKHNMGSVGTSSENALSISGYTTANVTTVEEWSHTLAAVTFTSS